MDYIVLGIVAIIILTAIVYIVRAKKKGVKCIGCSSGASCSHKQADYQKSHGCNCK
ncbi:FeoB-associated Cys-rich membrane protein [Anaerotignum sp. MB30-C6]|uniref:FeoB-associated Cys-rich membrane protein n=1 Tax=Anaerotignum sp. MB30-C6 TaxID=3070814 RepID=UPI0027DD8EDC|nr:FeoB-associated Cys-rich membrane protein [Anaerotignum sp. MB30-C6]WMI79795.1 FeoB-associated Cys-rich membrane protein [Anaerotignum sp. MB30-C6]